MTERCRVCRSPVDPESLPTTDPATADRGPLCPVCEALGAGAEDEAESIGPYAIRGVLGKGSVGIVYDAYDPRSGERRALKVLRPEAGLAGLNRKRFLREADILMRLDHPGIVSAVEVGGGDDGAAWIAMPLVSGSDLEEAIGRAGPPTWRIAARWAVEVASALHHAHKRRIVHRDIKPGNLLLDDDGRVRILDFGLAAALDASGIRLTATRATLGTPYFMPPEQVGEAGAVDLRADVYSLGATLYFLLTGRPPYPRTSSLRELFRHIASTPPADLGDAFPAPLEEIVHRAMAKDPAARYPSAKAMGVALVEILRK